MNNVREGSEIDRARWAKWDDLRARQEAATTDEEREELAREEEELRDHGVAQLLAQDFQQKAQWIWLSFADETGFLGVSIVEAGGIMEAAMIAKARGCNPGGEVQGYPISPQNLPAEKHRYRLMSEADLKEAGLI